MTLSTERARGQNTPKLPNILSKLQVPIILTSGIPLVNRIDFQALDLVGPIVPRPILDPLAEIHLDNRLYIIQT